MCACIWSILQTHSHLVQFTLRIYTTDFRLVDIVRAQKRRRGACCTRVHTLARAQHIYPSLYCPKRCQIRSFYFITSVISQCTNTRHLNHILSRGSLHCFYAPSLRTRPRGAHRRSLFIWMDKAARVSLWDSLFSLRAAVITIPLLFKIISH